MNGEVNCILAVCCPPGSSAQRAALGREIKKAHGCSEEESMKHAGWILANFDLAPHGSLTAFKAAIAALAREPR